MRATSETRALSGEIDIASREALQATLTDIPDCDEFIVDLRAATYIDSTGLNALVDVKRRLYAQNGTRVRLIVAHAGVLRVLMVCGLDKVFAIDIVQPESLPAAPPRRGRPPKNQLLRSASTG